MRAEAQPSGPQDALSDSAVGRPAEVPNGLSEPIRQALAELQEVVASRKVEPICAAYRSLREAAKGMKVKDLLELADRALGQPAAGIIVSAFSHLHCYMCNGGTMMCDQCEGAGRLENDRKCPQCDGFGVLGCNFCRGGGWAERGVVPAEIRQAVLDRQLVHVRRDLKRLTETGADLTVRKINALPQEKRREAIAWLIRLQARMTDLASIAQFLDPKGKAVLTATAARINSLLEALAES